MQTKLPPCVIDREVNFFSFWESGKFLFPGEEEESERRDGL